MSLLDQTFGNPLANFPSIYPDDPARTADHGYFAHERSEPAPDVTEDQAVEAVVMLLDGREERAFGEDLDYWHDVLLDSVCEPGDFRFLLLLGLGRGEGMSATRHFTNMLRRSIHDHALTLTA